ncbi:sigma-54-dependent transcriptional regulator [Paludisphaera borealis]|uniref:Transcriptional regulatory protein ZraR n=1 Tax=Paludisphaera borealis TaxID=1387353 RepID=A0A1U7CKZ0_9BACT|nr:sigma-54 dependent transcriptional regulator [Paludisphaera borealis]APW59577.1 Transcriptional regulatory protein ZraR [Paludisphaera borealis]
MSHNTNPASILVADDDPQFLRIIEHHIRGWGWRVESVLDKTALLRRLGAGLPGLLLMDVRFGEHDGLEVLQQIQKRHAGLKVVLLTAFGSIENAVAAVRLGAVDYLTKPVDLARLRSVVEHVYDEPATAAPAPGRASPGVNGVARPILGESRAIRELRALTERAAASDCTVLVLGESGTGKELVARALHDLGPRRDGPFIPLNVAALPRELVESTLFGHAKGAFTGADRMQCGCCEAADGGTLFLDEIGEMEIGLQAKLLRFLQERTFQRVGQSELVRVDVRIVAATNRDPIEQVRRGLLREDLYYRLNVVPIVAPPLRDRREDVPILARCFIDRFAARSGRPGASLSDSALAALSEQAWPGNVRELENFVERLAVLYPGPVIDESAVRAELGKSFTAPARPAEPEPGVLRPIDQVEYQAIADALATSRGNVKDAAQQLGLGQATVYRKIKKYGISV